MKKAMKHINSFSTGCKNLILDALGLPIMAKIMLTVFVVLIAAYHAMLGTDIVYDDIELYDGTCAIAFIGTNQENQHQYTIKCGEHVLHEELTIDSFKDLKYNLAASGLRELVCKVSRREDQDYGRFNCTVISNEVEVHSDLVPLDVDEE